MAILDNDPCVRCGSPVARFWKFCISCGAENPNFDRVEFAIQFGENIEDFEKSTCGKNHPDLLQYLKEVGEEPGMKPDPFCFVCGKQIISGKN